MILGHGIHDSEIGLLRKEFEEQEKLLLQEKEFLEKKAEDLMKRLNTNHKDFWDKIREFFKTNDRLPPWYDRDKYQITFNEKTGHYFLAEKEDNAPEGFRKFMQALRDSFE